MDDTKLKQILTDKEIEEIANPYIELHGDHFICDSVILETNIKDFARDIENAIISKLRKECGK